jgi:ankyrin repeat protein
MSATTSHNSHSPTILSHDDSTIDGKVFDWDDEIVNAASYRRALQHARSKSELPRRSAGNEIGEEKLGQTQTNEHLDRLSHIDGDVIPARTIPQPYEMSVVSEPMDVYGLRSPPALQMSSISEPGHQRRNILTHRLKTPETDKKSFWSSISGKYSSRNLASPKPNESPHTPGPRGPTSSARRGRRGFENSFHTSIDFGSEDGLSAPAIVRAAQAGSVVEVETLLDQRADINARHVRSGRTALAVASHCGNDEVVRLLLQYGARVNDRDATMMTPMHLAALRGHCGVVEILLQEHADIDAQGPNEETPLRIAVEKGQVELADLLLCKRAKVNARDARQLTPLHVAAKCGDESMTELLVSHGAHVEAKDANFMGALHYACEGGYNSVVTCLLNKKADVEARGKASMTPLLCASSSGQAHIVELLLKRRASLKYQAEGDMTALHWASYNGHVEVMYILLHRRASITASNKDGRTPLHLAVIAEKFAAAELLLRKGASIEAQCRLSRRPIHYACVHASSEITRLLLGHNASIEAEDGSGRKPLHHACTRGSMAHVELLLQKGVNIEARDADGDRPLCLASSIGHIDIVRTLLDRGAALRSKFASGPSHEDSPLCVAAKNGHVPVVQELLLRGASVLQKDERNWQPLRYAAYYAHPEVVELLLKHGATVSGSASGGWGFNITAHRIGFVNDVSIQEQRKGQVLRLLTSAEAREQHMQEHLATATAPNVPGVMQNQTSPTELPAAKAASPPGQMLGMLPPLPPRTTPELYAPPPMTTPAVPTRYTYYPAPPPAEIEHPASQQRIQYAQQPDPLSVPQAPQQHPGGATSSLALHSHTPSREDLYSPGYSRDTPSPMPSMTASQPQSQPRSTTPSYNFVPKSPTQSTSASTFNPAIYDNTSGGTPVNRTPSTGGRAASTMTLGPDGLWRSMNEGVQWAETRDNNIGRAMDGGAQWARDRETLSAGVTNPPNYPAGVYEMAS